jgi:hypothetical protein
MILSKAIRALKNGCKISHPILEPKYVFMPATDMVQFNCGKIETLSEFISTKHTVGFKNGWVLKT